MGAKSLLQPRCIGRTEHVANTPQLGCLVPVPHLSMLQLTNLSPETQDSGVPHMLYTYGVFNKEKVTSQSAKEPHLLSNPFFLNPPCERMTSLQKDKQFKQLLKVSAFNVNRAALVPLRQQDNYDNYELCTHNYSLGPPPPPPPPPRHLMLQE